jgi:hypothetical protein
MNASFARALICSFTIAGSVFLLEEARAQAIFRTEVYPVQTVTLSTADFLLGKKDGKPTMIAGELRIPKPGTDRLPAIVLVHGSGGVGFNSGMWAGELNKRGSLLLSPTASPAVGSRIPLPINRSFRLTR